MSSFEKYDAEINKVFNKQESNDEYKEVCLEDEIKNLMVYADSPKELEVLFNAYKEFHKMNQRHSF
ncbi:MAG: hypothetical protein ACRC1P_09515 [Cellulosilyticaceae bacterium]